MDDSSPYPPSPDTAGKRIFPTSFYKNIGGRPLCQDKQPEACGEETFIWLYKNYRRMVQEYAVTFTPDTHQVDDIVQEVFFRVWRHKEKLSRVADFNSWLFIVTKNYVTDRHQKNRREQHQLKGYQQCFEELSWPDCPETENEYQAILSAALLELTPPQLLVFQLQKQYRWKRVEVAKTMNLSPETVRNHMNAAMKKIRRYCAEKDIQPTRKKNKMG